ncbi:MAG TPA: NADH-quinone oxidoreductase subunit L [Burkholderiales bacterium]|nr:NADH-quinone oxidoreductase subunit L [Burkholderiales bacterium]
MLNLLGLIPVFPLAGFVWLAVSGGRLERRGIALVGAGSVAIAAVIAIGIGITYIVAPPPGYVFHQVTWTWINVAGFTPAIGFYLDALSLAMVLVVTVVGFLIHLYSTEFMIDDEGYNRYFAYMNLFVASMCVLVLADNLLFLYLGWEGVGLCSYLLIGFWYRDPVNGAAAQKAFIVTRIGDAAMAVGLFLLFTQLGTLQIQPLMQRAAQHWSGGSGYAIAAAALLLGGAVGKSAQLPLQTWLPDAMAGPTPVSALIHAATMVTAGVYLIARTHVLYALAPPVQLAVAIIGALTLLLAAFSALTQHDIKRALAYSTISQIGYMFLALGVGAWSAAIFHFMSHAFFKALLFLSAGVVIASLHEEHDIFKMGGLRKKLPIAFWTFVIGAASLTALPLVTAGFYSKDLILWRAWSSAQGSPWLWAAGWVGAILTGLYIFRVVFIAFFGDAKTEVGKRPGVRIAIPLIVLAVLSIIGGWIELPSYLGNLPLFTTFMHKALPPAHTAHAAAGTEIILEWLAVAASLGSIFAAWLLFLRYPQLVARLMQSAPARVLHGFWYRGWGFDTLYDRTLVQPYRWIARIDAHDFVDLVYTGAAQLCVLLWGGLSATQNGRMRWYAAAVGSGAIFIVYVAVFG